MEASDFAGDGLVSPGAFIWAGELTTVRISSGSSPENVLIL
jgi:hypothetical protein